MLPYYPDNRFIRSLEKKGIDYVLLETRIRSGSRMVTVMVTATANDALTADSAKKGDGFDLIISHN